MGLGERILKPLKFGIVNKIWDTVPYLCQIFMNLSTLRLPGLILRLRLGQAARACFGLGSGRGLRVDPQRRFFASSQKAGLGPAERGQIIIPPKALIPQLWNQVI